MSEGGREAGVGWRMWHLYFIGEENEKSNKPHLFSIHDSRVIKSGFVTL